MKKLLLLLLLFSFVTIVGKAEILSVENPKYAGRNTAIIFITKVELTPDETRVYIRAKNSPNLWVKISSKIELIDAFSAREYKLLKCEGFPLDTEHYMKEGVKDFIMYFEPLDDDVTTVDYVEGYDKGAFRVYGIQLKPETRPYIGVHNYRNFSDKSIVSENSKTIKLLKNDFEAINIVDNKDIEWYMFLNDFSIEAKPNQTIIIPGKKLRKVKKNENLIIKITEN